MTKNSIRLDNGLAPNRRQAIIWTNAVPVYWHIYAALGQDVLIDEIAPMCSFTTIS